MVHPLINNLENYTDKEISQKLNELHKKLNVAVGMGNRELMDQIQLVIQDFSEEYNKRQEQRMKDALEAQAQEESGWDFDDLINIG